MPGGSVSTLSDDLATASVVDEVALKEAWEDACFEAGFEYVDCATGGKKEDTTRNEFGELTGLARVKEALEAVEWEDLGNEGEVDDVMFGEANESADEDAGIQIERHELEREFIGLKTDLHAAGEDDGLNERAGDEEQDVEQLDAMLRKVLAVKDMSGHLTEVERQRMARKVVGEVMGDKAFQP